MRLLTICLLSLAGSSLFAQLQKGDKLFIPIADNTLRFSSVASPVGSELLTLSSFVDAGEPSLTLAPSLGFMLNEKFMVGGSASLSATFGIDGGQITTLGAFGRYYYQNTARLAAFAEVGTNLTIFSGVLGPESSLVANLSTGVSLPLTQNVLFTPNLNFLFNQGNQALFLDFGLEVMLNNRNIAGAPAVGNYGRGSLMLGMYAGDLLIGNAFTELNLSPVAHYFLTDRLAIGVNPGIRFEFFDGDTDSFLHFGTSARYYVIKGRHIDAFLHAGFAGTRLFDENFGPFTQADAGAGLMLFLRSDVALEAGLTVRSFLGGYENLNVDPDNLLGLMMGVQFFL